MEKCNKLRAQFVQPLNDSTHGPLEKQNTGGYQSTKMPFVFVLGNHSSGKSSFVNYVLGRTIQTAGVAPTDDSFTIIAPGPSDVDQDGPALVGDPDMGFHGLRQFGPTLTHHTQLKVRNGLATDSFMMVDSPGMIDSPVSSHGSTVAHSVPGVDTYATARVPDTSRGYNFGGVVRWFAERADVILLFYDPDKPGTTGETLSILTNALTGMDHKLYIILNKADQFNRIHDFARAYGSLCWNLSKVIPRKDLPRIYTMCLPLKDRVESMESSRNLDGDGIPLSSGLKDLETTRDEVKAEVMKAPKRRVDNVITRLTDSVHLLQVHTTILDKIQRDYRTTKAKYYGMTAGSAVIGSSLVYGSFSLDLSWQVIGSLMLLSGVGTGGLQAWTMRALKAEETDMISFHGLNNYFNRSYSREVVEGDESIVASWNRIRDGLQTTLTSVGIDGTNRIKPSDQRELQRILDEEVPDLRRQAAPVHFSFFGAKSQPPQ